MLNQFYRNKVT